MAVMMSGPVSATLRRYAGGWGGGEGSAEHPKGSGMSESELEKPVPDLVEQRREVTEEPDEPTVTGAPSVPFDVNEADAMEQRREVELDEDDYR